MLENNQTVSLFRSELLENNQTGALRLAKLLWLRANRGVLTRVARMQRTRKYTPEFVRQVFWEKRKHKLIRRALVRRGAPMGEKHATA